MDKKEEITPNDTLLPLERQQRVLELIKEGITIRVSRLSELLDVSEMTIRRDLITLENQGLVERTHGGAVLRHERMIDKFHYQSNIEKNIEVKQRIAQKAATLIEPDDIIYLGEGTTPPLVLRYVDPAMPFTAFTNNLGTLTEIEDKAVELVLLGGSYNPTTHSMAGSLTMEMIRQVYATKVFLSVDGLSLSAGLTTPDLEIAAIERSMIHHTRGQVVVMADQSRFGMVAEMVITPIQRINILISDQELPDEFRKDLESIGVGIIIA